MFRPQYTEAWNAIEYLELGSIRETQGVPGAEQMVKLLIGAQDRGAHGAQRAAACGKGGRRSTC